MGVDAAATDRLPWLADEPARQSLKPSRRSLLPWAGAAVALVAAAGFWAGVRSVEQAPPPVVQHARTMTIALPPPRTALAPQVKLPLQTDVRPDPVTQVRPAPSRDLDIAAPVHVKTVSRGLSSAIAPPRSAEPRVQAEPTPSPVARVPITPVVKQPLVLVPWNPRVTTGAAGRLVQVGAFGSVLQAKRGWWFMVREYPAMAHLPSVVRPSRNSKGRVFFRFQIGTTSQAHSEVLCQRMEKIQLSCAVVGLPWKEKVER